MSGRPVVIFGVGDFARIAHVYLTEDSDWDVVAFTVNERYIDEPELSGVPVVPFERLQETHPCSDVSLLVAVGFSGVNAARTRVYEECKALGYSFITYVHSSVHRWENTMFGENTFVFEENVVQPYVTVGNNVILWSGNHIGHDVTIEDNCFIASHAVVSGNVTIGHSSFIGVNATFRDGISIGPRCVIGAGAVIMKDTEEGAVHAVRHTEAAPMKSWELKNF